MLIKDGCEEDDHGHNGADSDRYDDGDMIVSMGIGMIRWSWSRSR